MRRNNPLNLAHVHLHDRHRTSRATPTPVPGKRMTAPAIRARKVDGKTEQPIVMLTAYTMRMAQLLDPHCDMLLVGDSLGQVIYGLPSTIPVTMEMMCAHGAAVVRGSWHALVAVDMPFGIYEGSPEQAFASAVADHEGNRLRGGEARRRRGDGADHRFLTQRGIPVIGHVGLTPQAVNVLGGYGARGRDEAEADKIIADASAVADAGAFCIVVEGVLEEIAAEVAEEGRAAGHRHRRLGRLRRPGARDRGHARPVRAHAALREALRRSRRADQRGGETYAADVRARAVSRPRSRPTGRRSEDAVCLCAWPARRGARQLPFTAGGEG